MILSQISSPPYEGEWIHPSQKKHKEVMILTHWYGGHKKQLKRHVKLINDLGFSAFVFNLFPQPFVDSFQLMKKPSLYLASLNTRWKKQLQKILSYIQEDSVVFSFSYSCNVMAELACQYSHIQGLIFDGGPFTSPLTNSWRYLSYQEVISNPFLRGMCMIPWNVFARLFFLKNKIKKSLSQLPSQFPILSFQSESDVLVPPSCITQILAPHRQHLKITEVTLKNSGHLQGIKTQPNLYQKSLSSFLSQLQ